MSQTNKQVAEEAAENRMYIAQLREESVRQQKGLDTLLRVSEDLRKQISALNDRCDEIPTIKLQVNDQKAFIEDLSLKFHTQVRELADFTLKTNRNIERVEQKTLDTQFHMKELEEYVQHLPETLILPSSQIRVETTAGFSDRPMALIEILSQCNSLFDNIHQNNLAIDKRLLEHDDEITHKAPETVLFQIHAIEKKVGSIEYVLEREEDQGIGAVRRQVEQLTSDIQSITSELHDKIDKDSVSLIVHEKYDEIVRYLQDALQSSTEDEQNFKAKADELQEMVFKLANSKCDRIEIIPMQEMLIKTEAIIRKLSSDKSAANNSNNRESRDGLNASNTYNKKEIEAMLELKVDKEIFEQQLQSLMKLTKKTRRLSSVVNSSSLAGNIIDQAVLPLGSHDMMSGIVLDSSQNDQLMWKGLADVMRDESDAALLKSQILSKINNTRGQTVPSNENIDQTVSNPSTASKSRGNRYNSSSSGLKETGMYGQPIQSRLGGINSSNSDNNLVNRQPNTRSTGRGTAPGLSRSMDVNGLDRNESGASTANSTYRANSGGIQSAGQQIAGQHITGRGSQRLSMSQSLPSHPIQGQGLNASRQSKTGMSPDREQMNQQVGVLEQKYVDGSKGPTYIPMNDEVMDDEGNFSPARPGSFENPVKVNSTAMNLGQDLNFIGAQVAGGGYNLKSANPMKSQALKATHGFADSSSDLEANGL